MDYPVSKEPKIKIEYSIANEKNVPISMNPVVIDNDNSLCTEQHIELNHNTRRFLNESITSPSRKMFLNENYNKIKLIYLDLNYKNPEVLETAFNILQSCILNNITDINVSKTGDKEILIYRNKNGEFSNLLIDEDGDVSFMFIGKNAGTERTYFFPKSQGFDYTQFTSLL